MKKRNTWINIQEKLKAQSSTSKTDVHHTQSVFIYPPTAKRSRGKIKARSGCRSSTPALHLMKVIRGKQEVVSQSWMKAKTTSTHTNSLCVCVWLRERLTSLKGGVHWSVGVLRRDLSYHSSTSATHTQTPARIRP